MILSDISLDEQKIRIFDLYAKDIKTSDIIAMGFNHILVKNIRTKLISDKAESDRKSRVANELAITMSKNRKRQIEFLSRFGIKTEAPNG